MASKILMRNRFDLIPIKKRILAFATDGEIEAKLRSILARRWGGKDFPKLTEIVYRLYMQWGRNGNGGIFKQGVLSAKTVKVIDEAIAEACRSLGIASWEAKNVVKKLDKEINMAFKRGVTDARLDLKKIGISMALDRRNEMLFDLNRAYREFDRSVRFAVDESEWIERAVLETLSQKLEEVADGFRIRPFPKKVDELLKKYASYVAKSLVDDAKEGWLDKKISSQQVEKEYFNVDLWDTQIEMKYEKSRKQKIDKQELQKVKNAILQKFKNEGRKESSRIADRVNKAIEKYN